MHHCAIYLPKILTATYFISVITHIPIIINENDYTILNNHNSRSKCQIFPIFSRPMKITAFFIAVYVTAVMISTSVRRSMSNADLQRMDSLGVLIRCAYRASSGSSAHLKNRVTWSVHSALVQSLLKFSLYVNLQLGDLLSLEPSRSWSKSWFQVQ